MADADDKPTNEPTAPVDGEDQATPAPTAPPDDPKDESPEEPQAESEEEPKEETPEEVPEESPEEEKPPSRREQLRVQDLLKKYGSPKETSQSRPDFRTKVSADEETYKTLEDTAQQFGQEQFQQGLERSQYYKWETLLNVDDPQVRTKYPQFDPSNKEQFHPALADAMNVKYLRFVGFQPEDEEKGIPATVRNPDLRYSDFVEAEMEFADEIASQRVAKTTENIAKQAANTGLRPDGSSAKKMNLNKAPEDMTDEELNAVISQNLPK